MFSDKKIWILIVSLVVVLSLVAGLIYQMILLPEMKANRAIEDRKRALAGKTSSQTTESTKNKKADDTGDGAGDAKKKAYALIENPNPDSALVDLDQYSHIKNENYYGTVPLLIDQGSGTTYQIVGPKVTYIKSGTLKKLIKADQLLYEKGYRIVLYCAYRDEKLQTFLRQHYENTTLDYNGGYNYVAAVGASRHQKGQAVDIAIESLDGAREEPTPYLTFTADITVQANKDNEVLKILQDAMLESGFQLYNGEWWHFDDKSKY